jgi:monoamine oxidase
MTSTRRAWLLGAASLLAAGCAHEAEAPGARVAHVAVPARANSRRVVVIGAGLSGLATALDLVQSGVEVVVLEAQSRPGGRILTIRAPFTDGLYVEAGATHVVGDPDLLALVASVGVPLIRPKPPRGLNAVMHMGGKRVLLGPDGHPPAGAPFSAEEEKLGFEGRLRKYFGNATSFDPDGQWPPPALARHDAQNGIEMLTELGASRAYTADFGIGLIAERMTEVSGAFVMREVAGLLHDLGREGGGRIAGGSDRLPIALAQRLGARVVYGAEVKRIEQDERGARVAFMRRGVLEHLDAERIVCAIPYSVLRHLEVAPGFSPAKQRAVRELSMVSGARVCAQFDRRFWQERGDAGDADTDLTTGTVRDETKLQLGTAGVLGAFLTGDPSRRITALPPEERLRSFVENAEKVHPGAKEHFVAGTTKCWDEDPFARGAFAWFKPGQMTELGPAMTKTEGRVHFAGDHTSSRPGWMHGALASAKRVVREVLAARVT